MTDKCGIREKVFQLEFHLASQILLAKIVLLLTIQHLNRLALVNLEVTGKHFHPMLVLFPHLGELN